jgi:hypothetical protein
LCLTVSVEVRAGGVPLCGRPPPYRQFAISRSFSGDRVSGPLSKDRGSFLKGKSLCRFSDTCVFTENHPISEKYVIESVEKSVRSSDLIGKRQQNELHRDIAKLLRNLRLPPLANEEWDSILRLYSKRYWAYISELIRMVRKDFHASEIEMEAVCEGNLRTDIDALLNTLGLPVLNVQEWCEVLLAFSSPWWRLVNNLIGEVRGEQHFRDVEAAIACEHAKDHEFSNLMFCITRKHVQEFCDESDEVPLTDDEMTELLTIVHEDLDRHEIICNAMDRLRREGCCSA